MAPGNPTAGPSIDKAIVQRVIRRERPRLADCYERRLLLRPRLAGRVLLDFTSDETGHVVAATVAGFGDDELDTCLAGVLRSMKFPPFGPGKVSIRYPLVLQPEGSQVAPSREAATGAATGGGAGGAGRPGGTVAALDRWARALPGVLHGIAGPVDRCVAAATTRTPALAGRATLVLRVDGARVVGATVHELGDADFRGCLAMALREARLPAAPSPGKIECAAELRVARAPLERKR